MIVPFVESNVRVVEGKPVVSYGLSSYGYDIRLAREFKIFSNAHCAIVDPKNFDPKAMVDVEVPAGGMPVLIPPNSFALARSFETFAMPRDVTGLCVGKSTYARCGIIVNITPLEAGWRGVLTIEISNTTPLPAKVYAGEGIAQVLFFRGEPCAVSYADRKGKYQDQAGIVAAKV